MIFHRAFLNFQCRGKLQALARNFSNTRCETLAVHPRHALCGQRGAGAAAPPGAEPGHSRSADTSGPGRPPPAHGNQSPAAPWEYCVHKTQMFTSIGPDFLCLKYRFPPQPLQMPRLTFNWVQDKKPCRTRG